MRSVRWFGAVAAAVSLWGAAPASAGTASDVVVVPAPPPELRFGPGPIRRTIFLNRDGGTYVPGVDDSSNNVSSVPQATATVPAWALGDPAWTELVTCVGSIFAPFDVEVTDVDPGAAAHIEAVLGGGPGSVGMPDGMAGVSPLAEDCSVVERAVVFVFPVTLGSDVRAICETAAHEAGHALGLDHELYCPDTMSYLTGCGDKGFRNVDASCGEDEGGERPCPCSAGQNTARVLYGVLGPSVTDPGPPAVSITSPADGAKVSVGFPVEASATDGETAVMRVELLVDGIQVASAAEPPWRMTTPPDVQAGEHSIEVRAVDASGNVATDKIRVEVTTGGPCFTPEDCAPTDTCQGGTCVLGTTSSGSTGWPCESAADCVSGMCADDGSRRLCTQACDPLVAASCPLGFACLLAAGGYDICWPTVRGPFVSGGCAAGGVVRGGEGGGGAAALLLLGVALAGVGLSRRRRSRSRTAQERPRHRRTRGRAAPR